MRKCSPSALTARFSGVRPLLVLLYASTTRPSRSATASIPEFGFGTSMGRAAVQCKPPSCESAIQTLPICLVDRAYRRSLSAPSPTTEGWMMPYVSLQSNGSDDDGLASFETRLSGNPIGPIFAQLLPLSMLRSIQAAQL